MSGRDWNRLQCGNRTTKQCEQQKTGTRNRLHKHHSIGHLKCVLCTETEHLAIGTSEMCTVQGNRTLPEGTSDMYTVHKNTSQAVNQKCVLCKETEHFTDGTHKAVFSDDKTSLSKETHQFTVIQTYQQMQLTENKSHT